MEKKTALSRAILLLQGFIADSGKHPENRLPSIVSLAKSANVSPVTMWKAVAVFKNRGILTAHPVYGIHVVSATAASVSDGYTYNKDQTEQHPGALKGPKWKQIFRVLEYELVSGMYDNGVPFPSNKQLSRRFGCCHVTIAKTLRALAQKRIIVPFGRTYRVPEQKNLKTANTVVLITRNTTDQIHTINPAIREFLREIQLECAKVKIQLEIYSHNFTSAPHDAFGERFEHFVSRQHKCTVLGFIVWTFGSIREDNIEILLRKISSFNLPIALEAGTSLPIQGRIRKLRVFSLCKDYRAGQLLGRFLVRTGHESIGYISPVHQYEWSQKRLKGLTDLPDSFGKRFRIFPYTGEHLINPKRLAITKKAIVNHTEMLLVNHVPVDASMKIPRETESTVHALIRHHERRGMLVQLIEKLLPDIHTMTALVAANDETAIDVIDILSGHGIRIPDTLSICAFDDTLNAFVNDLTSFNFNRHILLREMFKHILSPGTAGDDDVTEIDGYISERKTTR